MDIPKEQIEELNKNMQIFEKTYDNFRIVDPINKKIYMLSENKLTATDFICYQFWNKASKCENCVSLKAYNENSLFIKLEYHEDKVYMVTAIPVIIQDETVVVELFKDVSDSMIVVKRNKGNEVDVHGIINNVDKLIHTDSLTKIYNRRFIDDVLSQEIQECYLKNASISVTMVDIDLFKVVNDRYGHLAGDYVLRKIAKILESCTLSDKDWVARYGGEEFLICLPDTGKEVAYEIAEKMRKEIELTLFVYENFEFKVTSSFGVHTIVSQDKLCRETAIKLADENLYEAKRLGRNKVIAK